MDSDLTKARRIGLSPISVLNAPTRTAGILMSSLAAATAVWAFVAPIPVKITGLGVLAAVDSLYTYESPSTGRVLLPFIKNTTTRKVSFVVPDWSQQAYLFLEDGKKTSPADVESLTRSLLQYMDELHTSRISTSQFSGGLQTGGTLTVELNKGDVIAIIDNPAARQLLRAKLLELTKSVQNYETLIKLKRRSLNLTQSVNKSKKNIIAPLEELNRRGYASKIELIQAEADSAAQENNVTDQQSSLEDLQLTIQKNQAELRSALAQYLQDNMVFSFDKGFVQSFIASQWDTVHPGSELITVSWSDVAKPSLIPVFLDQKSATEVKLGDKAILTPLGFSAAEVGGIKGQVESLEPIPYTTATLAERLNSQGLAQIVSPTGSTYQVNIRLKRKDIEKLKKQSEQSKDSLSSLLQILRKSQNDNSGGYEWNNRSNPPVLPRQGFLLSTQITTRTNTPIQMLIPALKEFSGFEGPSKLLRKELNQP